METIQNYSEKHGQDQLIPFLWIRRGIGLLGMIFPVILYLGATLFGHCNKVQSSISDYYHTNMRDVFVGVLWVIGIFLFTYRGPKKEDSIATNFAAIFAFGISLFPTSLKDPTSSCHICMDVFTCQPIHLICAISFFLTKSYISYKLFPKLEEGEVLTYGKLTRNKIYKSCAYVMFGSMIIIAVYAALKEYSHLPEWLENAPIIFIFEWVALWAFGFSWLTKGKWFLQDNRPVNPA